MQRSLPVLPNAPDVARWRNDAAQMTHDQAVAELLDLAHEMPLVPESIPFRNAVLFAVTCIEKDRPLGIVDEPDRLVQDGNKTRTVPGRVIGHVRAFCGRYCEVKKGASLNGSDLFAAWNYEWDKQGNKQTNGKTFYLALSVIFGVPRSFHNGKSHPVYDIALKTALPSERLPTPGASGNDVVVGQFLKAVVVAGTDSSSPVYQDALWEDFKAAKPTWVSNRKTFNKILRSHLGQPVRDLEEGGLYYPAWRAAHQEVPAVVKGSDWSLPSSTLCPHCAKPLTKAQVFLNNIFCSKKCSADGKSWSMLRSAARKRQDALQMLGEGHSYQEVQNAFRVSKNTLQKWVAQANAQVAA